MNHPVLFPGIPVARSVFNECSSPELESGIDCWIPKHVTQGEGVVMGVKINPGYDGEYY